MGLDSVELIMAVEGHFDIEIDNEDAATLATCGKLSDHIVKLWRANGDLRPAEEIWEQTVQIIVERLGVKPEEVTREAKFIEDLGMD